MPAFDTSIRDRAIAERRERLEQERLKLIYVVAENLREIREKYGIREAYITGSLLQSFRWYQLSDVDVIVGGCSRHVLSIMGDVERATGKVVDVIDLDNHPSPDWAKKKGMMIYGYILSEQSTFKDRIQDLNSMAYHLHNLYGAHEQLFEIVATSFENQVASPRYHADLLIRMQTELKGIRPAFVSPATYKKLDKLRRFHHFFRHAYGAEIEADRLDDNVRIALQLREPFRQDMENFLEKLR